MHCRVSPEFFHLTWFCKCTRKHNYFSSPAHRGVRVMVIFVNCELQHWWVATKKRDIGGISHSRKPCTIYTTIAKEDCLPKSSCSWHYARSMVRTQEMRMWKLIRTGRPGVLQFMGSQRIGHNWATELNWTELQRNNWIRGLHLKNQLGENCKISTSFFFTKNLVWFFIKQNRLLNHFCLWNWL